MRHRFFVHDFLPQAVEQLDKGIDDLRIVAFAAGGDDCRLGLVRRHAFLDQRTGLQAVVVIDHRQQARAERDLRSLQAVGKTLPVIAFMVRTDDFRNVP